VKVEVEVEVEYGYGRVEGGWVKGVERWVREKGYKKTR